jgi:hypothetical protein
MELESEPGEPCATNPAERRQRTLACWVAEADRKRASMTEEQKPKEDATAEATEQLGEEELEKVAGGIVIVNSRTTEERAIKQLTDPLLGGSEKKLGTSGSG